MVNDCAEALDYPEACIHRVYLFGPPKVQEFIPFTVTVTPPKEESEMYEGPEDFTPQASQFPDLLRRSTLTEDLDWLIDRKGGDKIPVAAVRELIDENHLVVEQTRMLYDLAGLPRAQVTVRTPDFDNSVTCNRNSEPEATLAAVRRLLADEEAKIEAIMNRLADEVLDDVITVSRAAEIAGLTVGKFRVDWLEPRMRERE